MARWWRTPRILPYTYVGAGLDVMHSIVGFRQISHLVRDVAVEIDDGKLVGTSPVNTVFRALGSTAAFFAVLTRRACRGLWTQLRKVRPAQLPEGRQEPPTDLVTPDVNEPASGQEVGRISRQLRGREEIWRSISRPVVVKRMPETMNLKQARNFLKEVEPFLNFGPSSVGF